MAKADASRNYYAALNVAPTASESEIKKAYRQLALQYHPDRNPGHESDYVEKFQEIQAAFEVLCDRTQRAKYDADRRKFRHVNPPTNTPNTPRTRPPPPPHNAYTTPQGGTYNRPPPPKPQQQPPPRRPPPPSHHSTYTGGTDRFRTPRQPPTAQRNDPRAKEDAHQRANVFTAWQKMKQPRPEDARQYHPSAQSTPHTTPPGTAYNNPNGAPFGRSQSTRVPSSKQGFDPSTPGVDEGQARSSYRNYARAAPTPPTTDTTPQANSNQPKDASNDNVPFSEANRIRTPYYNNAAGERTSMFEGLGRSASVRNSPTHSHRPSPSQDHGAYSDSGRRKERNSYGGRTSKPFANMYPDTSDDSESDVPLNGNTERKQPPAQATKPPPPPPPTWAQSGFSTPQQSQPSNGPSPNVPPSFKSRSEESINMKFSPSDWHGKFEGSADYFAPNVQRGSSNKGRVSPTRGRNTQRNTQSNGAMGPPPISPFSQPMSQPQSYNIPPPPPGPPPKTSFPPPTEKTANTTFSPQYWNETFRDPHWINLDNKETSPRRASETSKRPKAAARKASVPTATGARSQDQPDPLRPKYQAFAEEAAGGDGDAMDIDSSTPPVMDPLKKGTRTAPSSPKLNTTTGYAPVPNGYATAPSSATTAQPPGGGLNGMAGLAEPLFGAQNGGIAMDDLKNTLPFDSQASQMHPTKPNMAQKLKFPDMPYAPPPPVKVDQLSADEYFNRMESYVKAYKKYSKSITAHFVARNTEMDGMDDHFIHHRGETTKKVGFPSYLAKMKEDEEVMETWKLAQERHISALQQCEEIRNKALKMYQTLQV